MIEKQFIVFSHFVLENDGNCECGFNFVTGDPMDLGDEDINGETVVGEVDGMLELYCPVCGKYLAAIRNLEVDEGFDSEMLQPFADAGIAIPFDKLDEMAEIYSPEGPSKDLSAEEDI